MQLVGFHHFGSETALRGSGFLLFNLDWCSRSLHPCWNSCEITSSVLPTGWTSSPAAGGGLSSPPSSSSRWTRSVPETSTFSTTAASASTTPSTGRRCSGPPAKKSSSATTKTRRNAVSSGVVGSEFGAYWEALGEEFELRQYYNICSRICSLNWNAHI